MDSSQRERERERAHPIGVEMRIRGDEMAPETGLGQLFHLNHLVWWSTGMIEKDHCTVLQEE